MVRGAVITFTLLIILFLSSFYFVFAANKMLDQTMNSINTMAKK